MGQEKATVHFGLKRRHRVEVYVLQGDHILAAMGNRGYPDLPGGGVDEHEHIIQAAMRELMEEAGWTAHKYQVIDYSLPYIFKTQGCHWLQQKGWDEEAQYVVCCEGLAFEPDKDYGSQSDALKFDWYPIKEIIDATQGYINNRSVHDIHYHRAYYRVMIMRRYFGLPHLNSYALDW